MLGVGAALVATAEGEGSRVQWGKCCDTAHRAPVSRSDKLKGGCDREGPEEEVLDLRFAE